MQWECEIITIQKFIGDIHCHSTVNPFNCKKSVWYHKPPTDRQRRKGRFLRDNLDRPYIQSDFVSLAKGKVKVVSVALGPVEWSFLTITRPPILDQGFFKAIWERILCALRKLFQFFVIYTPLGRLLSTYPCKEIRRILKPDRDYFNELKEEYKWLYKTPCCPPDVAVRHDIPSDTRIEIVHNYDEIQEILDNPKKKNVIAVILSIEGGHSLGCGQKNTLKKIPDSELNKPDNPEVKGLHDQLKANIKKLKEWPHVPFFLGLNHHFWNQLGGHSMSFANIVNFLFDQRQRMNTGITCLGKTVVRELLSASNGKRILIDPKHMSIDTKLWFYDLIEKHNDGKPDNEKIPVIVSHSGVNGLGTMEISRNSNDHKKEDKRQRLSDSQFNIWDINMTDEEIIAVHNSNGIIGLELDQRLLGGYMVNDFLDHLPKKAKKNRDLLKKLWVKPLINNILHIANTIHMHTQGVLNENKTIWDNIVLGCDFDGKINPIDPYCSGIDFPVLKEELAKRMKEMVKEGSLQLCTNISVHHVDDIVEKMMFGNMERFLKLYFRDDYLNQKLAVDTVFPA